MWCIRPLALVGTAALLVGAACAPNAPPAPNSRRSLTVAVAADMRGVNELISGGSKATRDILDHLFLHLFNETPNWSEGPPTFEPALAASIRWNEDGTEAIVALRKACWSDGRRVSAEDVAWTWRVQRSAEVAWRYGQSKERIVEVSAVDASTVRFRFASAYPGRMTDLNEGAILPRHAWSSLPLDRWREGADWFREHLVTSGRYTLREWQPGQRVVLEAAPSCSSQPAPPLDRLVFEVVPDRSRRISRLLVGDVDYVAELTPREAVRLSGEPAVRVRPYTHRRYEYVAWNLALPLFAQTEVRRALTMAIDRHDLAEALWNGWSTVAVGPIPRASWAAHPDLEPWPYDPAAARARLAESGWTDSDGDGTLDKSGHPFSFELLANADNPLRIDQALMIQEQLRRIGVEARVVTLDFRSLVERLDDHTFQAALGAWDVDTSLDLTYAFHSSSIDDGYNSGGYREPEVDRLIEESRRLTDREELLTRLRRLQELLHRDQPYTFLSEPLGLDAHDPNLEGVEPSALGSFRNIHRWRLASG